MSVIIISNAGGGSGGMVNSVTAGDLSIVVGGTATNPTVETGTLDEIATLHPPAGNWSNNSKKITALANGSGAQDAAAFGQIGTAVAVETARAQAAEALLAPLASPALTGTPTAPTAAPGDTSTQLATDAFVAAAVTAAVQGLAIKPSVQEATAAALPANTYSNGASGVGATLTAVLAGVLTVDGIAVALLDRVLVKNEVAAANNGIYVVTTLGTVSVAYILTRATDMNQAAEVPGAFTFVEQGTVNAGAGFTVASEGPFTIGTTAIIWTQFSGAGEITAGANLVKSGNTISLAASPAFTGTPTGISGQYLAAPVQYAPARTVLTTSSATMAAVSSANVNTGSFTAPASGDVIVTASFVGVLATSGDHMALALAAHGTITPLLCDVTVVALSTQPIPITIMFLVTGLTPGNSYNLDLMWSSPDAVAADIIAYGQNTTTPAATTGGPVIMTVQAV